MFTGLVQALGELEEARADGQGGRHIRIRASEIARQAMMGESIAVNGVCLSVNERAGEAFDFQAGPETLAKTNLGELTTGDRVNLERALRVGDALGGHFVTGHVDCIGRIAERVSTGDWQTVWFEFAARFDELLVEKGSVAVDGVSLTVVDVLPGRLSVMLIPHTLANTTLGPKPVGAAVNLEFDLLAKHVRKLFQSLALPR